MRIMLAMITLFQTLAVDFRIVSAVDLVYQSIEDLQTAGQKHAYHGTFLPRCHLEVPDLYHSEAKDHNVNQDIWYRDTRYKRGTIDARSRDIEIPISSYGNTTKRCHEASTDSPSDDEGSHNIRYDSKSATRK